MEQEDSDDNKVSIQNDFNNLGTTQMILHVLTEKNIDKELLIVFYSLKGVSRSNELNAIGRKHKSVADNILLYAEKHKK